MPSSGQNYYHYGPIKFFRIRLQSLPNSEIEKFVESYELHTTALKDEIFRISWYMRGGVSSHDLFHVYSFEDRKIMNDIIKENIETTKATKLPWI